VFCFVCFACFLVIVCLFGAGWGGLGEGLRVDETIQYQQNANKQTTKQTNKQTKQTKQTKKQALHNDKQ
jgi:hypothetical protein